MLEEGKYYHVYNRGNNSEPIFFEPANMKYFMKLTHKYMGPIAQIYAYCLLKNHFHLLLKIDDEKEWRTDKLSYSTIEKPKLISPEKQISNLFNAYTQAINKRVGRTGKLFEGSYKSKEIDSDEYFIESIIYIHNNPVKHNITKSAQEYAHSSFNSYLTIEKPNKGQEEVLKIFGGLENFITAHV